MIEVLFSESEAGSMKIAKNYRKPSFEEDGPTAWFGKKPSREVYNRMFDGEPVGGLPNEVVTLPFMLHVGDIQQSVDSDYRKNLIYEMYTIDGIEEADELLEIKRAVEQYVKELIRLKEYAENGETLRIWYSEAPYSICGFYHLCQLLEHFTCKVSVVKMPENFQNYLQFSAWSEVMPGEFYLFLPFEKEISKEEIAYYSKKWTALAEDNSPLRAVINGQALGVPEDFYDFIIRKEMPNEEFKMARLIGGILSRYPLGVSDWWYGKRINRMAEMGELIIIEDSERRYERVMKRKRER